NQKQREIVALSRTAGELVHRRNTGLLQLLAWRVFLSSENLLKARDTEQFFLRIRSFGNPIAEKNQRLTGLQLRSSRRVCGLGDESYWERSFGKQFANLSTTHQQR